jgi:hypothetical protein
MQSEIDIGLEDMQLQHTARLKGIVTVQLRGMFITSAVMEKCPEKKGSSRQLTPDVSFKQQPVST